MAHKNYIQYYQKFSKCYPSMFIDTNYASIFKYRYNENNMNIVACVGNDVTYCDNNN